MKSINQYRSKIVTQGEREVAYINETETLIEQSGEYLIRSYRYLGQARVRFYRGIDEKNDADFVLEDVREGK